MQRAREAGLTLIEMLVTLAIIGIAAAAVTLSIGSADRGMQIEAEARQLVAGLSLAADKTIVTDRPVVLEWDSHGYAFAGARHDLPSGLSLSVSAPAPVRIDAQSGAAGFSAILSGDGARWAGRWQVRFDGVRAVAEPAGGS